MAQSFVKLPDGSFALQVAEVAAGPDQAPASTSNASASAVPLTALGLLSGAGLVNPLGAGPGGGLPLGADELFRLILIELRLQTALFAEAFNLSTDPDALRADPTLLDQAIN